MELATGAVPLFAGTHSLDVQVGCGDASLIPASGQASLQLRKSGPPSRLPMLPAGENGVVIPVVSPVCQQTASDGSFHSPSTAHPSDNRLRRHGVLYTNRGTDARVNPGGEEWS